MASSPPNSLLPQPPPFFHLFTPTAADSHCTDSASAGRAREFSPAPPALPVAGVYSKFRDELSVGLVARSLGNIPTIEDESQTQDYAGRLRTINQRIMENFIDLITQLVEANANTSASAEAGSGELNCVQRLLTRQSHFLMNFTHLLSSLRLSQARQSIIELTKEKISKRKIKIQETKKFIENTKLILDQHCTQIR